MTQRRLLKWTATSVALLITLSPLGAQDEAPDPDPEEGVTLEPSRWTGRFDLGYTWQSGRTEKNELSIRGEAERDFGLNEYRGLAEFRYGEVEGVRNTHRYNGEFRWRRDLSERWFLQTMSLYEADRIRKINHRLEQNIGLGYRVVDTERVSASVVPGFTLQYTDESGVDDKWDYLANVYQDFRWQVTEAYRLEEDVNVLFDPADTGDYIVRFNAGIAGTLRQNINLSIRYQLLYESRTRDDVESTDQRIVTSIGYAF